MQRFLDAQQPVFEDVCRELRGGIKLTHWIWFIFPQIRGLGRSPMAEKFAISSRDEAKAYLEHPVLGPRLKECARLVSAIDGRPIEDIFEYPDYMKFRSSMTLFAQVSPDSNIFNHCLQKYFHSKPDPATLAQLQPPAAPN